MTSVHDAWQEVGSRLEALGLKLKLHFESMRDEKATETVDRLRAGVQETFEAAGQAMKGAAVRADVRGVGRLLAEALAATLGKVGDDRREAAARRP